MERMSGKNRAAKTNQSKYPWSQNVVSIGLIKIVKGRWACLPLAFRFYHMEKTIVTKKVRIDGNIPPFQTKFEQAIEMLLEISAAFPGTPLLIVTIAGLETMACLDRCAKLLGSTVICFPDCASTPLCLRYHPNTRNISSADPESMATRWAMPQHWPMNSMNALPLIQLTSTANNAMFWPLTTS